jgi:hypothetical protein
MDSVFYSDMYQYDMVKKRWYPVLLRAKKAQGADGRRRKARVR